ncbi:RluA family pseudouridine synthase [Acidocella aquatica]|uniref:RluA family pseudouridine synthase n=1 Tax=Acidocella aquatica TaxID=1922313 RepID=UPI0024E16EB5|nr:RNA pseudouridine synthase [Acidocella aquatica]
MNKPAGLPVHAGRAGGPSVEDFFPQWRLGRDGPWLAHRLDQDTAGCLVIALKKSALLAAQACFADGRAQKTYWAVVRGVPKALEGAVDLPLAKVTQGRSWKMAPDGAGQPALTLWRVMGQGAGMSWIEFSPKTGRTHQIRAHAAALGHPIMGDAVYGGGAGMLHLLARRIVLPLEPELTAQAPVPAHMAAAMRACGHAAL